jgi:hypothetical protein
MLLRPALCPQSGVRFANSEAASSNNRRCIPKDAIMRRAQKKRGADAPRFFAALGPA